MSFLRQTWTLSNKTIKIALGRHTFSTLFRAFLLPVVYIVFLSYAKNLLTTPQTFGIGSARPVHSLQDGMNRATGGRNNLVFVNSGYSGGNIDKVIDIVAAQVSGKTITRLSNSNDLLNTCPGTLRGVSACYGAVVFNGSPTEGSGGFWNYTLRADASLATKIDVNSGTNDAEIYGLPLQRAVDMAIASLNTTIDQAALPSTVNEYPFTSITEAAENLVIRVAYNKLIITALAAAFLVSMVGIVYHMAGFIAMEREIGMSHLIEAMMPNKRRWVPQICRIMSYHSSFTLMYLPGWIVIGLALGVGVYAQTSKAIVVIFHILAGLALASWAILGAVFFKKAQLSGIIIAVVTLALGILAQVLDSHVSRATPVYVLGLLFAPSTYVFFVVTMSRFEVQEWRTDLLQPAPESWNIKPIVLIIFLVIQIFAYPILAIFVERWLHGVTTKGRTVLKGNADQNAVVLQGFTKLYFPGFWQRLFGRFSKNPPATVTAVSDLSFVANRGQILVLLGANGSGKSTTLDAIAGLNTVTSGLITVDGTGGIGICPQKNVLWGELTVDEHVRIFNALKVPSATDSKAIRRELIRSVDLDRKLKSKASTLSGGQKRKLQLGMMLTGGSSVCMVDEVSSGLDPLSRRKIWDILLSVRGVRTIIMTTHFLDEADLLADDIVILSKGTLRAQGSPAALKQRLGGGYRVNVVATAGAENKQAPEIPGVSTHVSFDQTTYMASDSAQAARIIKALDKEGVQDYQLSEPTIEDVFLQLAEEINAESDEHLDRPLSTISNERPSSNEKQPKTIATALGARAELDLLAGRKISFGRQAWVLYCKRFTLMRRNWFPAVAALVLPILVAGIVTTLIKGQSPPGCSSADQSTDRTAQTMVNTGFLYDVVGGPSTRFPLTGNSYFTNLLIPYPGYAPYVALLNPQLTVVNSTDQFNNYISTNFGNVTAGYYAGDASSPPQFAYLGFVEKYTMYASIFSQNLLDRLVTNMTIVTQYAAFDVPFSQNAGNSLQLVVYMCLVFAAYPAFFGLYPNIERTRNVRGLQYSNGVRPLPLWLAYLSFDMCIVITSCVIVIAIFAATSSIWYYLGYVFLILILHGLASTLFAYVVSLFASTQLATFAIIAGFQAILFLGYLITYLSMLTYSPTQLIDRNILIAHYTISLVSPMGSLLRSLFVTLNLFSTTCNNQVLATNPSSLNLYGGPILYLILQSILFLGVLLWWDSKFSLDKFRRSKTIQEPESSALESQDAEELKRVQSSNSSGLRVMHLTKSFGKLTAVEDITFGIQSGEVFALLGPNGAGKSTTISLIRGDIQPSRNGGDIFVDGIPIRQSRAQARSHLGVCPQFDAMDQLTVVEHLRFYARIRGVPDIEHNVQAVIVAVGLTAFSSRMAFALSGGNKRKLSLGIALMGNPQVLLLDEPSSGMDAAAKRVMWKTLASVVGGRAILLTTHSMEEAGALATRAGIMARRMLALGTTESLRKEWGDAFHVQLVAKTAPHTDSEEMERLRAWVLQRFPGAEVEPSSYHGQMRFSVPAELLAKIHKPGDTAAEGSVGGDEIEGGREVSGNGGGSGGMGALITILEDNKEALALEHYSVGPTTLDSVFLNVVTKHNIEEENYETTATTQTGKKVWGCF